MARPSRTGGNKSDAKARSARPADGRKTTKSKPHVAPAVTGTKRRPVFGPTKDLKEAREQQAATAEILKVIASSPDDVQPVFEAIATNANRLIGGFSAGVYRFIDGVCHLEAFTPINPAADKMMRSLFPRPVAGTRFQLAQAGEVVEITDTETLADDLPLKAIARARGFRSVLDSPLMSKGTALGVIVVTRKNPGSFSSHHAELLRTFADQAVIAIENVRLFNEVQAKTRDLSEALQQQTATTDVLKVISRSAFDLDTVMDTLASSARSLCRSKTAALFLRDGDMLVCRGAAAHEPAAEEVVRANPVSLKEKSHMGRAVLTGTIANIGDFENNPHSRLRKFQQIMGFKSFLAVPLMREGQGIGVFALTRDELGSFSKRQVELVQGFADQAVIAIENVRLFNETQEALERQTATAEILNVIASSPTNVQPVFDAIAASGQRLVGGFSTSVLSIFGDMLHLSAFTPTNPSADAALKASFPRPLSWEPWNERIRSGETIELPDVETDPIVPESLRATWRTRGFRSLLLVPLMRSKTTIGMINATRKQPGAFAPHHVQLLQTFADQAVIAIENTRLFNEVQAKTRDLTEALTYQTGSSNILSVIASSPTDVGPVLKAIVESACELCEAYDAIITLKDGNEIVLRAHHGPIAMNRERWPNHRASLSGRAIADRAPVHLRDVLSDEGAEFPIGQEMSRLDGVRSMLCVPMIRDDDAIGTIVLRRTEVHPFSDRQIALLQTFADQAVIAIGNVRLFEEVQAKTRDLSESLQQQTATSEVLEVISASPGELEPVFAAMLKNAVRLCDAKFAMLILYEKETNEFRGVGKWNLPPAYAEFLGKKAIRADPKIPLGRVAATKKPVQVADILVDQSYLERFPGIVAVAELGGARTLLQVPMLKDDELVGTIAIYRQEVRPFTDKQIALVQNFAAQAVIAIENARLLNELRQRTDDLTESLNDLRTAQDRLVQTEKLASLGQLTAGIAHEIKNPLNFVNNFSALTAELTDELNDLLKPAPLDDKMRGEADELTGMIKDNLQKVVQHGKRADSIVKNMLLHSREGSREHRPADINSLLDESLNLAYHGARAEKGEFNITLQRDFDADAGTIELFPQEITRAFLNLIANGVYAATRRKTEEKEPGFEPTLRASTKNLGTAVEIRIRDNGSGIPPEVQEKMFNPFFTTKPAGEGTGLGLSMTHDIIVKQHGGRIDVATEPGQFTEFIIVLPRMAATGKAGADK